MKEREYLIYHVDYHDHLGQHNLSHNSVLCDMGSIPLLSKEMAPDSSAGGCVCASAMRSRNSERDAKVGRHVGYWPAILLRFHVCGMLSIAGTENDAYG